MTLEQVKEIVRAAARSIPPSDAGSTRAIDAVSDAVWERMNKLTWQVRDTCARAEKAEAALARIERTGNEAGADMESCRKALYACAEIATKALGAGVCRHAEDGDRCLEGCD